MKTVIACAADRLNRIDLNFGFVYQQPVNKMSENIPLSSINGCSLSIV